MKRNRLSTVFLTQVAAFLTACSGNGSFLGIGSSKSNGPDASAAGSAIDSNVSDESKKLIVAADPETREEFEDLMNALIDPEMRAAILDDQADKTSGVAELAFMLDDDQFVDYVADFNSSYNDLNARVAGSEVQVIRIGQEIADFMTSKYPAAVETLRDYADRFPPDDVTLAQIQKLRESVLPNLTATDSGAANALNSTRVLASLGFRLQQPAAEGDKGSIDHGDLGSVSVQSVVDVEAYANVAAAANVAGVSNAVAVTNVFVVAEVFLIAVVA